MPLNTFNATHVSPGQPLTAQSWNDLVDGISDVHTYLQATIHTVHVQITNTELAPQSLLETVRVFAVQGKLPPVEAVRPVADGGTHVLTGLSPGSYIIRAKALGYTAATAPVTVAGDIGTDTTVTMALAASGTFMPNLFGLALKDAKTVLADKQISFSRLLDFNGRDMAGPTSKAPTSRVPSWEALISRAPISRARTSASHSAPSASGSTTRTPRVRT